METFSALLALYEENPPATDAKASGAELWSVPKQTVGQTVETPVILDGIAFIMMSL